MLTEAVVACMKSKNGAITRMIYVALQVFMQVLKVYVTMPPNQLYHTRCAAKDLATLWISALNGVAPGSIRTQAS